MTWRPNIEKNNKYNASFAAVFHSLVVYFSCRNKRMHSHTCMYIYEKGRVHTKWYHCVLYCVRCPKCMCVCVYGIDFITKNNMLADICQSFYEFASESLFFIFISEIILSNRKWIRLPICSCVCARVRSHINLNLMNVFFEKKQQP